MHDYNWHAIITYISVMSSSYTAYYDATNYSLHVGRWADIGVCIQFKDEKYHYFCE